MPNTDYDPSRDSESIIKAGVMDAAFREYHTNYILDNDGKMKYMGSKATVSALPATASAGMVKGNVYNVTATNEKYVYDGSN